VTARPKPPKPPDDAFYCGKCGCMRFHVTRAEAGVSLGCSKCGRTYEVTVQVQTSQVVTLPEGLES
jgi:transcription elongation factor Elf1